MQTVNVLDANLDMIGWSHAMNKEPFDPGEGASKQAVNVQEFLNRHPFSAFQWIIFAICFLIVLLDGFDTAAIGFIAPSLLKEWSLSKAALAPVLSAALFGLAAGGLVAGPVADRIGRKTVLVSAVTVSAPHACGRRFRRA